MHSILLGIARFPKPDFTSGYQYPEIIHGMPWETFWSWLDVVLLLGMMSLVAWAVHRKPSRKIIFSVSIVSVLYFGFFRTGCVCSVGSIQNVVLALADSSYKLPFVVLLLFLLAAGGVFYFFGSSKPDIVVADVNGKPVAEAQKALEAQGFKVELENKVDPSVKPGLVLRMDPVAGIKRKEGATITLTVSGTETASSSAPAGAAAAEPHRSIRHAARIAMVPEHAIG